MPASTPRPARLSQPWRPLSAAVPSARAARAPLAAAALLALGLVAATPPAEAQSIGPQPASAQPVGARPVQAQPADARPNAAQPAVEARVRAELRAAHRVEPLLDEAEAAYRAQRDQEAFAAFGQVVALVADEPRAWLRIGNLWQRNGEPWRAAEAYRRAALGSMPPALEGDAAAAQAREELVLQARAKAALNLAALGVDQAREGLQAVDRARLPAELQPLAETLQRRVRALEHDASEPPRPVLR